MDDKIPVVNLGTLGLSSNEEPSLQDWKRIGAEISVAFSDIGFVYLSNHGIPSNVIEELFMSSREFFTSDSEVKSKYRRGVTDIQGYTATHRERLSTNQGETELRESYDVKTVDGIFPNEEVASFRPTVCSLIQQCQELSNRLLVLMAVGLGLDRSHFLTRHKNMFSEKNATSLRILFYPPVPPNHDPGLIRCGQHTDYGTFTLLFQDSMGGLEVLNRAGNWVQADPIPNTLLVNIGDLMQFWTDDKFRATEHRVLVPAEVIKQRSARHSVACFVHPDDDVLIEPLTGSSKYTPITSKDHTDKRFKNTYQY